VPSIGQRIALAGDSRCVVPPSARTTNSSVVAVHTPPTSALQLTAAESVFVIVAIAFTALMPLALTILTSQRTTSLFEGTINQMNHGVAMFDDKEQLILRNDRYGQINGLTAEQLRPATSLREIIRTPLSRAHASCGSRDWHVADHSEGNEIDAQHAALVPQEYIGRLLSPEGGRH
jgi:transcriptional regulator with PAS, ATPase and Fis domain